MQLGIDETTMQSIPPILQYQLNATPLPTFYSTTSDTKERTPAATNRSNRLQPYYPTLRTRVNHSSQLLIDIGNSTIFDKLMKHPRYMSFNVVFSPEMHWASIPVIIAGFYIVAKCFEVDSVFP